MSPVFPVPLTQLETKALFVHCFATLTVPVPGMDEPLQAAFESGVRKLQDASHRHFVPGVEEGARVQH